MPTAHTLTRLLVVLAEFAPLPGSCKYKQLKFNTTHLLFYIILLKTIKNVVISFDVPQNVDILLLNVSQLRPQCIYLNSQVCISAL
jgi:hypothetical protein